MDGRKGRYVSLWLLEMSSGTGTAESIDQDLDRDLERVARNARDVRLTGGSGWK